MSTNTDARIGQKPMVAIEKMKYCLYSRKSTDSDERQALSIESQIKEMMAIAEREGLDIVDVRRDIYKISKNRP